MSLSNEEKVLYTVILYDAADNEVRRFEHVLAWSRREAYYSVMYECRYSTWDAIREKAKGGDQGE